LNNRIKVLIDDEKCNGCGCCAADCQRQALEIQNEKARVIKNVCLKCGHCLAVCPHNAVKLSVLDDEILEMPDEHVFLGEDNLKRHLKFRRSIRHYKNVPVEKEKLEKIIEAGRLTPTASNSQNVRYIIIQNEIDAVEDAVINQYKESSSDQSIKLPYSYESDRLRRGFLFHKAPVVILAISPSEINACLAAMNMELMAEALGLGVVYVGLFTRPANVNKKLRETLGIAEDEILAACLALGYPDVQYLRSAPREKAEVKWI
jgi:nitroreductase/NAD-dependent dihydropyrimidine dehydrogenase PreA subunit